MVAFILSTLRLLRAFSRGFSDKEFQGLFFLTVLLLLTGTFFYSRVEGWTAVDSFYFSTITLTTIGYGDLAPQTTLGKLFTIVYVFLGLGLVFGFVSKLAHYTGIQKRNKK